jgi:hypothetical protein
MVSPLQRARLGIGIDEQDLVLSFSQSSRKVHANRSLPCPAFLIGNSNYGGHIGKLSL